MDHGPPPISDLLVILSNYNVNVLMLLCMIDIFVYRNANKFLISNTFYTVSVYAAGICGAVGVAALGLYCILCFLHVTMQMGRGGKRSILTRRRVLISKLLFVNMAGTDLTH